MAVSQRLELRQSQSLVMTPQLQQAIKLLQFSSQELAEFVERELEQNPLLEREEGGEDALASAQTSEAGGEGAQTAESFGGGGSEDEAFGEDGRDSFDHALSDNLGEAGNAPLDATYEYDDNSPSDDWGGEGEWSLPSAAAGTGGSFEDEGRPADENLAAERSFRDGLLEQVQLTFATAEERLIAFYLLDGLDEAGYLQVDLDQACDQLGCTRARLEEVLATLQTLEPAGIFARDLKECLKLQLIDRNRFDPAMASLLDNLELMASRDFSKLQRVCGVDDEDFAEMLAELRQLDPKPALLYNTQPADPVVPDILMRMRPDGSWQLELNPDTLPRVLVNRVDYNRIVTRCRNRQEKEFVNEQFQAANWLVRSLHQRANTILRVSEEIVRQQDGFFRHGVSHLRPLILRTVAEAIEMHESTVSRVTNSKFISTPRGVFELKYFFSTSISGTEGGEHSSESVRHRIRSLIDDEPAGAILSDDAIVAALRRENIDIARRTVAKYRESMNIPSSVQRRRDKAQRAR
ncbi:RNA polymerase factor sigma-54 [Fodinicurvata halophila]|uniref:RNA polymerase sigma-54 factor n=1 Tax=Fodinicurvata halophila TaxID=1419723 RepID=A0ABV8UKL2_9PROT